MTTITTTSTRPWETSSQVYNINPDPGSVRSRPRIPISKLTLEQESEIPEKPKDIIEKPNDKHYEKALKEFDTKIDNHYKNLKELRGKIKDEKFGNNPERAKLKKEKEELFEKLNAVNKEIEKLVKDNEGPDAERKNLRNLKDSLQKEIEFNDIKDLNAEIKAIQNKLGFSVLNAGEEKKLIDRKNRLEAMLPKVQEFTKVKQKLASLNTTNKGDFQKVSELKANRKTLNDNFKKVKERLKHIHETSVANDVNIKQLETQCESIRAEIDRLKGERSALNKEWDDKHYKYEQQQKLLEYIKNAQSKISELKKKAEREKKRQEKLAKKLGAQEQEAEKEEADEEPEEEVKFGYEIATTEWLISYFKGVAGDKTEKKDNKQVTEVKNDDNKLVPIARNDKAMELGLSGETVQKDKKKGKGPKVSKREQKVESTNILSLDLNVINKIKDIKLNAPVFKSDVLAFVEKLEKVKEMYVSGADHQPKVEEKQEAKVEN